MVYLWFDVLSVGLSVVQFVHLLVSLVLSVILSICPFICGLICLPVGLFGFICLSVI